MYDMKKAEERILEYCAERAREDAVPPEDIACALMNEPGVLRMHGPEHHTMVGAALLTAYRNAGGALDLEQALPADPGGRLRLLRRLRRHAGRRRFPERDTGRDLPLRRGVAGGEQLHGARPVRRGRLLHPRAALLQAHDAGGHIRRGVRAR